MKSGILRQSVVAIGALTLSTVLATGIGIYAFLDIGQKVPHYLEENASRLTDALNLTESAGELLAKAPKVFIIDNALELESFWRAIHESIQQLDANLATLKLNLPPGAVDHFAVVQKIRDQFILNIEKLQEIKAQTLAINLAIDKDLESFWQVRDHIKCFWLALNGGRQAACGKKQENLAASERTIEWVFRASDLLTKMEILLNSPNDGIPELKRRDIDRQFKDLVASAIQFSPEEKANTDLFQRQMAAIFAPGNNLSDKIIRRDQLTLHLERLIRDRRITSFKFTSSVRALVDDIYREAARKNQSLLSRLDVLLVTLLVVLSFSLIVGFFGFFYFKTKVIERLVLLQNAVHDGISGRKDGYFEPDGDDEIGMLGKAYSYFIEQIETRERKIIGERDKAHELAGKAENQFHTLYNQTPVLMHSIGTTGVIENVNEFWLKTMGFQRSEVIGRDATEFLTGESRIHAITSIRPQIARDGFCHNIQYQMVKKDGTVIDVLLSATSSRDEAGAVVSTMEEMVDITERKRLEAQLYHSQKMEAVGQLTSGIAHDFNNILAIVLSNLELLQLSKDPATSTTRIQKMLRAVERGANLTKRLLVYSGDSVEKKAVASVNQVFNQIDDLVSKSLTAAIKVDLRLAENPWLTKFNMGELQDSILNLSINAGHAMPDGGTLLIRTENCAVDADHVARHPGISAGDYVLIEFADTGVGMSQQTMDKAFDPFFSTKERGKGTGLGLSMVHGFVRRMGGFIEVESELGKGTTFKIYLPRSYSEAPPVSDKINRDIKPPRGTETILVVDDEPSLVESAQEHLRELGYIVLTAHNGASALTLLHNRDDIDLMFSDVVMPGAINGISLASQCAEIRPNTRILLTSGYAENQEPPAHYDTSGNETALLENLLRKPYNFKQLAISIRQCLDAAGHA